MKKAIYKFHFGCGRQGDLEGVFVSTQERVDKLVESQIEVYFGEVLGKHSEVLGPIDEGEITFVSDNEEAVRVVEEHDLSSGYNPFDYPTYGFEFEGEELEDVQVSEVIDKLLKK